MARRENPEINAGSMADIAFLLLIFFLVTTTMNVDSGVSKKLSEKPPADYVPPIIKQKNIFEININRNNELLVEGERMEIKDLKDAAIAFINNGGGEGKVEDGVETGPCNYCNTVRLENEAPTSKTSSDHPNKAIISVQSDRLTEYGTYLTVQDWGRFHYQHLGISSSGVMDQRIPQALATVKCFGDFFQPVDNHFLL